MSSFSPGLRSLFCAIFQDVSWHAFLGSFLAIRVSQTVPVIDKLKVLRNTIQIYCGRHFYWNLPADFSLIKLGSWFWEEDHRNRVLLKSTSYQATYFLFNFWMLMMTLINWLTLCLSGFSTVVSLGPFQTILWKEDALCNPHVRSRGLSSPSSEWGIYIIYLEFSIKDLSLLYY